MKYKVVVFGVKNTTEEIVKYMIQHVCSLDLIVTINQGVTLKNDISGYTSLDEVAKINGIEIYKAESYSLNDDLTKDFFNNNSFDIGISMGWQRLIPKYILDRFTFGIYGFHGNCGYLPFGRGRSPLNWNIIQGDTRFNLNLFKYDEKPDSPNIFCTEMFSITIHDDIQTAQYKNMICAKRMIRKLIDSYKDRTIVIKTNSKDFDYWYAKRTPADGKIDFREKTRNIYNLIRGVAYPFPGAFGFIENELVRIWRAIPFDEMIDFSDYKPGEIVDIFDGNLVVRTVDGSILITEFDCNRNIIVGDIFE